MLRSLADRQRGETRQRLPLHHGQPGERKWHVFTLCPRLSLSFPLITSVSPHLSRFHRPLFKHCCVIDLSTVSRRLWRSGCGSRQHFPGCSTNTGIPNMGTKRGCNSLWYKWQNASLQGVITPECRTLKLNFKQCCNISPSKPSVWGNSVNSSLKAISIHISKTWCFSSGFQPEVGNSSSNYPLANQDL